MEIGLYLPTNRLDLVTAKPQIEPLSLEKILTKFLRYSKVASAYGSVDSFGVDGTIS